MERISALLVGVMMLGFVAALSFNDPPHRIEMASAERDPSPRTAVFSVLRICFPDGRCIDDHGRTFDNKIGVDECTKLAAAKVGGLASGARILRGYCQEEPDRDSYQIEIHK